jgi:2-methylcitrate dehydratase PrpD
MAINKTKSISEMLAQYCAATMTRPLPPAVIAKTKHHLLDTLGAIISGACMEPGKLGARYVRGQGGRKEASVFATRFQTTAVNAALANGMAAHADETDDSHPASITHPGCAVIPAALAMAERGKRSGLDLLKSIALGYDITARFGIVLGAEKFLYDGFDSHAFGGTMGAAAAAGSLTTDDPRQMNFILSYGVQQASGLATLFRDQEHIEKAFVFGGMPAKDGVTAATMVKAGMTGVADPFDGNPSFFSAFNIEAKNIRTFRSLGKTFEVMNTNIKRWSVGSPAQAVLDALETLQNKHRIDISNITEIRIHLAEGAARIVDSRNMPDVNVQHLTSVMLLDGTVSFAASHDFSRLEDPKILALRKKIKLVGSRELTQVQPRRQAIVEIDLADGRRLKHRTLAVRGTVENPMSSEEIAAKAFDLFGDVLGNTSAKRVIRVVQSLDRERSLKKLITLLRGS